MPHPSDTEINGLKLGAIVEAILFSADKPLSADDIASVIVETELAPPIDEDDVVTVINRLNQDFEEQGRAFTIQVKGGGYTFATLPKYHSWLEHFQHQNAKRKISPSAVEALAIIAYRQPITKPEIDHIRGVDSGYIVRQLMEKQLIEIAGRYDGPGRALLYRTTSIFLQHFDINSIDELPKPREIEEILKDDDMAEHRQLMLELKSELQPPPAVGAVDVGKVDEAEISKPANGNATVDKIDGSEQEQELEQNQDDDTIETYISTDDENESNPGNSDRNKK
ncbi:MAG: SMC-Scp complex subunit ScpB [Balneolales bacterium]